MRICRFTNGRDEVRIGLAGEDATLLDLTAAGIDKLQPLLESDDAARQVDKIARGGLPAIALSQIRFRAPVERQEVWAAGVTYLRSKQARMEESNFSATAYDKVYAAPRPEIFFKSPPEKVIPAGQAVGIRRDSRWSVPEPELALVLNSRGKIAGYTIGNDMSARDIEGENLLYLPQAKTYDRSCALGPWIELGATEADARTWEISIQIHRDRHLAFAGKTSVGQIKRGFQELAEYLFRSQRFPNGAILLTGTGVVPPDDFTLEEADVVAIQISGIGILENPVVRV